LLKNYTESKELKMNKDVFSEIAGSLRGMAQSEIRLAKAEFLDHSRQMTNNAIKIGVFSGLAIVATLPFLAFCVIGLGRLIGDNYWLSSLLVAIAFLLVGSGVAYLSLYRLKHRDLSLKATQTAFNNERQEIRGKLHEIGEAAKRRMKQWNQK
jgi:uncharacterized membrane protein YqjE